MTKAGPRERIGLKDAPVDGSYTSHEKKRKRKNQQGLEGYKIFPDSFSPFLGTLKREEREREKGQS